MANTLRHLIQDGLKAYQGRPSFRTSSFLARNLVRHLGAVRASRFNANTLRRYRAARSSEGASGATVNRELGFLRTLLRTAQDAGLRIQLPNRWGSEREVPRTRTLAPQELSSLLDDLNHRSAWARALVVLLLGTGARVGELLAARVADVTCLEDGTVRVLVRSPKERDPKVLVATNGAADAARALLAGHEDLPLSRAFGRANSTQLSQQSSAQQDYELLRHYLRSWCDRNDRERLTPHDLRRTFATWALRKGATLEAVGAALGHRSVSTTRRYARLNEHDRAAVAELVTGAIK